MYFTRGNNRCRNCRWRTFGMGNCVEACKVTNCKSPGLRPSSVPQHCFFYQPTKHSDLITPPGGQASTNDRSLIRRHDNPHARPSTPILNQAKIFKKKMCEGIRPPSPSQLKALEVRMMENSTFYYYTFISKPMQTQTLIC